MPGLLGEIGADVAGSGYKMGSVEARGNVEDSQVLNRLSSLPENGERRFFTFRAACSRRLENACDPVADCALARRQLLQSP